MDWLSPVGLQLGAAILCSGIVGMLISWLMFRPRKTPPSPVSYDLVAVEPIEHRQALMEPAVAPALPPFVPRDEAEFVTVITPRAWERLPADQSSVQDVPEPSASLEPVVTDVTLPPEATKLAAQVVELERQLRLQEFEYTRLETGATTAWDTHIPRFERRIDALTQENSELAASLLTALDQLENQSVQVDSLRKALVERDRRLSEQEGAKP